MYGASYKAKFPEHKYVGDPVVFSPETNFANVFPNWKGPDPTDGWEQSKQLIDNKNKKREFLIKYNEEPRLIGNRYEYEIKILSTTKRGFIYSAHGRSVEELKASFWPMVVQLLTHTFSPKLVGRPMPVMQQY